MHCVALACDQNPHYICVCVCVCVCVLCQNCVCAQCQNCVCVLCQNCCMSAVPEPCACVAQQHSSYSSAFFFSTTIFGERTHFLVAKSTRSRICEQIPFCRDLFLPRKLGCRKCTQYRSAFFFDNQFFDNHFWRKDTSFGCKMDAGIFLGGRTNFWLSKVRPIRQ